jgi:DNA polymerase-3 subunit alpha
MEPKDPMEPNFIHLRLHTEYSLSDGLIAIPALFEKSKSYGMPAVAVTDRGNLYATIKFYQSAMQMGIKPIIGVDIDVLDGKTASRLTLLCQSNEGYKNLLKLISKSFLEGQANGTPQIKKEWLPPLTHGLIALSGGMDGDIGQAILANDIPQAKSCLQYWQSLFPDRFYIEIARVGKPRENTYIAEVAYLAEQMKLPLVATNDVRFLEKDDFDAHEARVSVQEGMTLSDPHRKRHYTEQQYFRSPKEMQTLFADMPEALQNTIEIAKRCNLTFQLGKVLLPHFPVPEQFSTESYLVDAAKRGLDERLTTILDKTSADYAEKRKPYDERLEREIDVINKMGFAGYFLIVADFIHWSKDNGIPVGPGRGSGPGSLVAFALKITDLDPLAFELLFERFLNPERVSMPDFDVDFCMDGRDRVIEYVMAKHGHESVSQIITYGTMAAKAVVRDVGRVLGLSYGFVDKIAKLIPFELGITLDKAMEQEPLLRERYSQEEEVRTLIDLARKLEGVVRNVGKHAGGIVIAPGKLTDFVPLSCEPNESQHPVTQFDKDDVESAGLIKFDFLGLKTLTIIDRALKVINLQRAKKHEAPVDITLIPLQDPETFKLLKACQSTAVFQLESFGMRDLIKRLQPDCFEDLIALVALFRPGPLQSGMVDDFINRKHGRAKVEYPHPKLEPVLKPTYGVILYQEQVMQIAQVLAGYTLGAADILRRAMGKKKPEEMAKQREIFCKGAVENNVPKETATYIFDLMEKFAGYGFNKSHSAAYALIAYQTAWLKAHYPAAFMAAVLSSDMDRTEKIIGLLDECEQFKLHVSPPDINSSDYYFTVVDEKHILYGLGAIKGVGEAAIENILASRQQDGAFKNLFDFCARIDLRKTNKRVLEALIKSGTFDCFKEERAVLMASLNNALQQAEQTSRNKQFGQHDLLGSLTSEIKTHYVDAPTWRDEERLQGEKETLGFYLTGHPLDRYLSELNHITTCRIVELNPSETKNARIAGIVTNVRTRQTKRGDRIGIFTLHDGTHPVEIVCFSEPFQKYRHLLNEDQLVIVDGEVSHDDFSGNMRVVGREIHTLDDIRTNTAKRITVPVKQISALDSSSLKEILINYIGGKCPIVFESIENNMKTSITLGNKWLVKPSDQLISLLQEKFQTKVELVY